MVYYAFIITATKAKISMFVVCVEAIIYLLLHICMTVPLTSVKQTLFVVTTAAFCFQHDENNLIRIKFNWSLQAVNESSESALSNAMRKKGILSEVS